MNIHKKGNFFQFPDYTLPDGKFAQEKLRELGLAPELIYATDLSVDGFYSRHPILTETRPYRTPGIISYGRFRPEEDGYERYLHQWPTMEVWEGLSMYLLPQEGSSDSK